MKINNEVQATYEEAAEQRAGGRWLPHFGGLGLDLSGFSSRRARRVAECWRRVAACKAGAPTVRAGGEASLVNVALHLGLDRSVARLGEDQGRRVRVCGEPARRFCAEALAREWAFAAEWLDEVESDARWAADEAREAVRAAEAGDWGPATRHAHQACSIESAHEGPRLWGRLERAIEEAAQ